MYTKKFIRQEDEKLNQINNLIQESIDEKKLLTEQLARIAYRKPTLGERIADKVATFGGSWTFIITFIVFMILWMGVNVYLAHTGGDAWDEYPFILLNLTLSTLAALQAPVILMSQNRHSQVEHQEAEHDYIVNMKAEMQVASLHKKIDMMMLEHMKTLLVLQEKQLALLTSIQKDVGKDS